MQDDCIIWTGGSSKAVGGRRPRTPDGQLAYRAAWEKEYGPIPEGLFVCHKCDNSMCVNVNHLFLGTQLDNMRDCAAKGRAGRPRKEPPWLKQAELMRERGASYYRIAKDLGVGHSSVKHHLNYGG